MSKTKAITSTQENQRINFSSAKGNVVTPDFLDIQLHLSKNFSS
jgi:DNA-directed RNA polymerase subunit beta